MKCTYCGKNHKDINCPIIGKIVKDLKGGIDRKIIESFMVYQGKEKDKEGKTHDIYRKTCTKCKKVTVEYHRGCCGYTSNGFMEMDTHECGEEK